jgi:hypothetical protein
MVAATDACAVMLSPLPAAVAPGVEAGRVDQLLADGAARDDPGLGRVEVDRPAAPDAWARWPEERERVGGCALGAQIVAPFPPPAPPHRLGVGQIVVAVIAAHRSRLPRNPGVRNWQASCNRRARIWEPPRRSLAICPSAGKDRRTWVPPRPRISPPPASTSRRKSCGWPWNAPADAVIPRPRPWSF